MRQASIERNTTETRISVAVALDGTGDHTVLVLDHLLVSRERIRRTGNERVAVAPCAAA